MIVATAVSSTTFTTAMSVDSESIRSSSTNWVMFTSDWAPTALRMKSWIVAKTPRLFRTYQTTAVATTVITAIATARRNASFMTDHGSIRETESRTRRGPVSRADAPAGAWVAAPGAPVAPDTGAAVPRTPPAW